MDEQLVALMDSLQAEMMDKYLVALKVYLQAKVMVT
jgi:hypothetical protein